MPRLGEGPTISDVLRQLHERTKDHLPVTLTSMEREAIKHAVALLERWQP